MVFFPPPLGWKDAPGTNATLRSIATLSTSAASIHSGRMPHRNMPPCGWVQRTSDGKTFFHHFEHHIAAFLVNLADDFDMLIQEAAFANLDRPPSG